VSYVKSVLQPGEQIKAIGKLHWIIFTRAILLIVLAFVICSISGRLNEKAGKLVEYLGWIALLFAALAFLTAWFRRWITELAVTNHRVIYKRGFLQRHTVEMNMDKVETVDVDQSILGRLLDYGTIRVRGTGQSLESFSRVAHPVALRSAITAR
jgi:uncharacterized membrane protein YdbT with pleckstrin-like domain